MSSTGSDPPLVVDSPSRVATTQGRADAVYVTYWSLNDPLCRSQSLPVVRALAQDGYRMVIVTYEQEPWSLPAHALEDARAALLNEGIDWIPLRYHKRPRMLATAFDILHGIWVCSRTGAARRIRLFHGRGTVATAIAYASACVRGARFFNDADGPLSDEYADSGVWKAGSVLHRLTRRAERHMLGAADAVAVLTTRRRDQAQALVAHEVTILPCGVDVDHFRFREGERRERRRDLGLKGTVLVYAGKAGGWYLTDAMLDFAAAATEVFGDTSLLVLTNDDPTRFMDGATTRGIRCVVTKATREEMPGFLSAGDAGLSFVLSAPSKASASPVKNGEYLACGLPVVSTPAIGDYSDLIERNAVGVIVRGLDAAGLREGNQGLAALLKDPGLQGRCVAVARAEVSLTGVVLPRYRTLYQSLLGPARTAKMLRD